MNEEPKDKERSTQLAEERTDLALQRTIIASERTLMAWIRTAIAMIGFGFTLYKFLQYLRQSEGTSAVAARPQAPRNLALALVILAVVSLIAAIWQHRVFMKRIGATEAGYMWSFAVFVAILVAVIGVLVLIGMWFRTGPF